MILQSVLGPIDSSELGDVLIHEHITFADRTMRKVFGDKFFDEELVENAAVLQFEEAKKYGVKTIVDGSAINLGRDISLIKNIAERTGLNFILSSGFYYQNEVYLEMYSEDEIYNLIISEFRDGIEGTSIRPGILKVACGTDGVTDLLKKTYRAIGRVAVEEKVPIFCHHNPYMENGNEILDIFESVGVLPNQVVLGHSGDSNNLEYLKSLLKRGCYLGLDTVSIQII